jgi:pyruvyl transferase EpsO
MTTAPAALREHEAENANPGHLLAGMEGHAALMSALSRMHGVLAQLIGGRRFHYVDIPVHGNIGDLLIMQGTMAFYEANGLVPRIISPAFAYRPGWIGDDEAIVFHGGGNFGDLYWEYGSQKLREQVAASHPGNRIIVLPQTLHFSSPEERQRSARVFRGHPDLHLCVRDEASRRLAVEFSDHVYLLPDMAHQLYPLVPRRALPKAGVLMISRTDGERAREAVPRIGNISKTTDWPALVGSRERHIGRFRRAMQLLSRVGLGEAAGRGLANAWISYSRSLTADAADLLAAHEHLVSDRLHGHILACLMGIPSTVVDNFYGKNANYVGAWTGSSSLVKFHGRRRR